MAAQAPTCERIDGDVYLVVAYDGDDSDAPRDQHLEGHLNYVEKYYERYLVAGPMFNPGESRIMGSFFLLRGTSEQEVREFLSGDPYMQCGMYADVRVQVVSPAVGSFMGGVIWDSVEGVRERIEAAKQVDGQSA